MCVVVYIRDVEYIHTYVETAPPSLSQKYNSDDFLGPSNIYRLPARNLHLSYLVVSKTC